MLGPARVPVLEKATTEPSRFTVGASLLTAAPVFVSWVMPSPDLHTKISLLPSALPPVRLRVDENAATPPPPERSQALATSPPVPEVSWSSPVNVLQRNSSTLPSALVPSGLRSERKTTVNPLSLIRAPPASPMVVKPVRFVNPLCERRMMFRPSLSMPGKSLVDSKTAVLPDSVVAGW